MNVLVVHCCEHFESVDIERIAARLGHIIASPVCCGDMFGYPQTWHAEIVASE